MKLQQRRVHPKETYCISDLYIDREDGKGWQFLCNVLEDTIRDTNKDGDLNDEGEQKIYGKTAIPYGTYKIIMCMSKTFKRDMPCLINVPGFTGILMHPGVDENDTLGCLLVGKNKVKGKLVESRATFDLLMKEFRDSKQDSWTIEII